MEKHTKLLSVIAENTFIYPDGYHDDTKEDAAEEVKETPQTSDERKEEPQKDDEQAVMELIAHLREKLDSFESEGLDDILKELEQYRYHEMNLAEMTKEIKSRVDDFDFLGASGVLDSWEEKMKA